jgi:hypothetical protein
MYCPKCTLEQDDGSLECPKCGIVFSKYRPRASSGGGPDTELLNRPVTLEEGGVLKALIFDVEPHVNPFYFSGRLLLFLVLVLFGFKFALSSFISTNVVSHFLHLVNLPFHEAGHLFFRPLGRFMTSLGGSLGQLSMPLVCFAALLIVKRDNFGASACLWWFGENFIDLAPYINDARALSLPLLGGNTGRGAPYGFHDWEFILSETGLLRHDHLLAGVAHKLGVLFMALALVWAGYILFKQYENLDRSARP